MCSAVSIFAEICESQRYNAKTDMWSAGCILYELAAGTVAFQGANMRILLSNIIRGVYVPLPKRYSPELCELVRDLLQTNPRRRLSVHQVLQKPIMRNRIEQFLSQTGVQREFAHTVIHGRPAQGALLVSPPRDGVPERASAGNGEVRMRAQALQAPLHSNTSQQNEQTKQKDLQQKQKDIKLPQRQREQQFWVCHANVLLLFQRTFRTAFIMPTDGKQTSVHCGYAGQKAARFAAACARHGCCPAQSVLT